MPLTELLLLCRSRAGVSLPALGCRGRLDLRMETWRIPGPSLTCGGRTRSSPHSVSETTAEGIAPAKSETQKYFRVGWSPGTARSCWSLWRCAHQLRAASSAGTATAGPELPPSQLCDWCLTLTLAPGRWPLSCCLRDFPWFTRACWSVFFSIFSLPNNSQK